MWRVQETNIGSIAVINYIPKKQTKISKSDNRQLSYQAVLKIESLLFQS